MIYYRNTLFGSGPKLTAVHQLNIDFPKKLRIVDLPFWGEGYDQELLSARVIRFNLKN